MALLSSRGLQRLTGISRSTYICPQCRFYASPPSTTLPAPPLLLKLRTDLKTAMKEKDTNRLNVLRALLAEITNSAKTNSPIKTDMQLLSLLRKRASAAKAAEEEFRQAGREDLVEREEGQVKVLEEYAGTVQTMSEEEVRAVVTDVIAQVKEEQNGKAAMGEVLKKLLAPGGSLDGRSVEKSTVARVVKELLAQP